MPLQDVVYKDITNCLLIPALKSKGDNTAQSRFLGLVFSFFACGPHSVHMLQLLNCVVEIQKDLEGARSSDDLNFCNIAPIWSEAVPTNPAWGYAYTALREDDIEPLLGFLKAHPNTAFSLALNASQRMCHLYASYFYSQATYRMNETLQMHSALLKKDAASRALLAFVMNPEQRHSLMGQGADWALVSPGLKALVWYCWGRHPEQQLCCLPSNKDERCEFANALKEAGFKDVCKGKPQTLLSTVALFLTQPWVLSASLFNSLNQMVHDETYADCAISQQRLIITTQGSSSAGAKFPSYELLYHQRPLHEQLKKQVVQEVQQHAITGEGRRHFTRSYPNISDGVSSELVRHNLELLLNLYEIIPVFYAEQHPALTGMCILAWFTAAGFQETDALDCVQDRTVKDKLKVTIDRVKRDMASCRDSYVYAPMPTLVDVRYVAASIANIKLFELSNESAYCTSQQMNMVRRH